MGNKITISVVTATWNCSKTLPDCLASVAQQNYANREHVIVDGASTDGTIDIINQYIEQITTFKSERDKGIYDAMNKGIISATGDFIVFLNANDIFYDNQILEKVANRLIENPTAKLLFGNVKKNILFITYIF